MKSQVQSTLEEKGLLSSVNLMTRVVSLNIWSFKIHFLCHVSLNINWK